MDAKFKKKFRAFVGNHEFLEVKPKAIFCLVFRRNFDSFINYLLTFYCFVRHVSWTWLPEKPRHATLTNTNLDYVVRK